MTFAIFDRISARFVAIGVGTVLFALAACSGGGGSGKSGASAGAPGAAGSIGVSGHGGQSSGSGGASGGQATAGTGGAQASLSTDEFWAGFAQALCQRYLNCASDEYDDYGDRARLKAMGDESDCARLLASQLSTRNKVRALNRLVMGGVMTVQADQAEACFEAAALCDYPGGDPDPGQIDLDDVTPCREVFEGPVPSGGDCDISEECAGDSMCIVSEPDAGSACSGICAPRLKDGADCSVDRQCGNSLTSAWPACVDYVCQTSKIGAPAAENEQCDAHSEVPRCEEGLWCYSSKCTALFPSMCSDADPDYTHCLDGICVGEQCEPLTVVQSEGDACDDELTVCDIYSSLVCDGGQCVHSDSSAGGVCFMFRWYERALCDEPSGSAVGDYCSSSGNCSSGACRVPETVCVDALCTEQ